ncbi:swi5-dependent recombination DNA repair protein 1 homolog [Xenia sp. Carnegie-2017]|uniref:swi5-dependent recombination DNA repair protein 1 homolog n=1 Tax=Xenia sp. Carnegie-2017 TaxID=2897299 RepID=UPI001F049FE2|nr:swi5-dependent recombination DNA repair protein 1 homolog [Xenia sp. Carnegie-2017]XP_046864890.1 swi5-dependent recombination DNA repair protein 1 homolog [Xenia sp. Carnegie-2017]
MNKKKSDSTTRTLIQSPGISSQFASPLTSRNKRQLNDDRSSLESKQNISAKRIKYNSQDDDDSTVNKISRNEKKELELELKKKEDILRKLKLVKMFRTKNSLSDLDNLITKWRAISQESAKDLYEKFNQEEMMSMGEFLNGLRVKHELIRYSEEEEAFY